MSEPRALTLTLTLEEWALLRFVLVTLSTNLEPYSVLLPEAGTLLEVVSQLDAQLLRKA